MNRSGARPVFTVSPPIQAGPMKGNDMKAIRAGACAAAVLAASLMLAASGRPSPEPSVPVAPPPSAAMRATLQASPMPAPHRTAEHAGPAPDTRTTAPRHGARVTPTGRPAGRRARPADGHPGTDRPPAHDGWHRG